MDGLKSVITTIKTRLVKMITKITVADYMSKSLVTLTKDNDVFEAIKKLLNRRITCAPVMDEQGALIGMFSEKDGMKVVLESAYNQGVSGKVSEFMSTEIISIQSHDSVVEVAEKFKNSSVRSFPVYDDVDLVGVISRTDILRALVTMGS